MVDVPTGLGKTAMAVLGWLWRRNGGDAELRSATPRRLVYCLPMRTLVEQSKQVAETWIKTLRDAGRLSVDVPIHILMGGEDEDDWVLHPEQDAIIIGTQDMLLSRALNRGYAMSRSRWPIAFGMLNNDCLWIFDEIQLMGPGLATTAQLEAFRHSLGSKDGHGCQSVWMSATLNETWLDTVD
ncbi:MAG: DEAD/DEAH box helicase, partial [Planctomycetota bacterium]